jgi:hypothetical protein
VEGSAVLPQRPIFRKSVRPFVHLDRSEAKWRDLRFSGPFLEMFSSKTVPKLTWNQARIRFIYLASTASSSIIGP